MEIKLLTYGNHEKSLMCVCVCCCDEKRLSLKGETGKGERRKKTRGQRQRNWRSKEKGGERRNGWRKMWQRWVIAEGIEMVQLHLMVSQRGVIASERERKTERVTFSFSFFFCEVNFLPLGEESWWCNEWRLPNFNLLLLYHT